MNTRRITFPNAQGELLSARLELPDDEHPTQRYAHLSDAGLRKATAGAATMLDRAAA